jgi:hypothetical protein
MNRTSHHPARLVTVVGLSLGVVAGLATPAHGSQAARPDLVPRVGAVPSAAVAQAEAFLTRVTVRNRRAGRAGRSTVSAALMSKSGRRFPAGSAGVRRIRGFSRVTVAVDATVPAALPGGQYALVVCADARRRVSESNERNNCTTSARPVHVAVADSGPPAYAPSPNPSPIEKPTPAPKPLPRPVPGPIDKLPPPPAKITAERTDSGPPGFKTSHGMSTRATLFTGVAKVTGTTQIWSHAWFGGFTGTVMVLLADRDGELLTYAAPGDSWGVNGLFEAVVGSPSDRTEHWQADVRDASWIPLTSQIAIVHSHAPRNRLFDILNEGVNKARTAAEVVALIAAIA